MFEVRAATAADRADVVALLREMIPECDAEARLAWLYERNPAGRALTWLARDRDGTIAGCTSYFPYRLSVDGSPILAALGGDGYVRSAFRRRGVGALLHAAGRDAMPRLGIACMYGAPGAMNLTPLKHGGSREVGHVARWVRPVGLRGRLDAVARVLLRPRGSAELVAMTCGDRRVDEVWRRAAGALRIAAVRDAPFYTWRFVESPAHREPAFVVVDRGEPIAACALELGDAGARVHVVDLVAVPGAWHTALEAIARHAADLGARSLEIRLHALDGRRRSMWRSGFVERERKPFLVMVPQGGDRRLLDPLRWFYGGADSDLDLIE
jgi:hypothetical protein